MMMMNSLGASPAVRAGGYRPSTGEINTHASFKSIQRDLQDDDVVGDRKPYVLENSLHYPTAETPARLPRDAKELPVTSAALKNLVTDFIKSYPKESKGSLMFLDRGGLVPPGYVSVSAEGSGLEIFYQTANGKQMGA